MKYGVTFPGTLCRLASMSLAWGSQPLPELSIKRLPS